MYFDKIDECNIYENIFLLQHENDLINFYETQKLDKNKKHHSNRINTFQLFSIIFTVLLFMSGLSILYLKKYKSLDHKKEDFKILMSHDPSHWEAEVVPDNYHYHLTLSGHTHGMQFGIEIPGWIKWSPVKWRYKQWAGIYEQVGQYINVNRGFGYLGYPGRVGIWPEITVIELRRGKAPQNS